MKIDFSLNGKPVSIEAEPMKRLLAKSHFVNGFLR